MARADWGARVCVTASHNPAKYNGYKVYGPDGCQITPEAADQVLARIRKTFDGVKLMDYDAAKASGKIREIPDACLEAFVDAVLALRPGRKRSAGGRNPGGIDSGDGAAFAGKDLRR